jgi:hypothetical protein
MIQNNSASAKSDDNQPRRSETQVVGNAGMYYAAYRLSQMGWNVMPTARNARGVDLLAYNKDATNYMGIQIKTLSKRNPVPLGKSIDKLMGSWWIIVAKVATKPECFIMKPEEVKRLSCAAKSSVPSGKAHQR